MDVFSFQKGFITSTCTALFLLKYTHTHTFYKKKKTFYLIAVEAKAI